MAVDIKIPSPGESITEVEIGEWLKANGDWVDVDETVVVIETDKANLEVPSPAAGVLQGISSQAGDLANVGDVIAQVVEGARPEAAEASAAPDTASIPPVAVASPGGHVMPSAQRVLHQGGVNPSTVTGTGPGGRVLKEDAQRAVSAAAASQPAAEAVPKPAPAEAKAAVKAAPVERKAAPPAPPARVVSGEREEQRTRMSRIRRTIAGRLVAAQQEGALLTTFNEVDMTAVKALRASYKQAFADKYGVKLGFMSFFVKACVSALKACPLVNARIEGDQIIQPNYADIGVAVGGGKGLIVPVMRSAGELSFADIELSIADFGRRAQDGTITPDELSGGTFTISNGGVYGSMMSTPIVNPPQSGILGMHAIQDRAVVRDGQVVVAPMMYVALTYDHRLVDGREAVTFLVHVKQCIEDPSRMMLEV